MHLTVIGWWPVGRSSWAPTAVCHSSQHYPHPLLSHCDEPQLLSHVAAGAGPCCRDCGRAEGQSDIRAHEEASMRGGAPCMGCWLLCLAVCMRLHFRFTRFGRALTQGRALSLVSIACARLVNSAVGRAAHGWITAHCMPVSFRVIHVFPSQFGWPWLCAVCYTCVRHDHQSCQWQHTGPCLAARACAFTSCKLHKEAAMPALTVHHFLKPYSTSTVHFHCPVGHRWASPASRHHCLKQQHRCAAPACTL